MKPRCEGVIIEPGGRERDCTRFATNKRLTWRFVEGGGPSVTKHYRWFCDACAVAHDQHQADGCAEAAAS